MTAPQSPALQDLRCRAQGRVSALDIPLPQQDPEAALHELRVFQAELEIQNEELIAARARVEASQKQYFRHFDLAPVGLLRLSREALVLDINILAARMLGYSREAFKIRPRCFVLHVAPRWHLDFQRHLESALASGKMATCELVLLDFSGAETFVRMQSVCSPGEEGLAELYVTLTDLSEHRKIEQRLASRHAELHTEMVARLRLEREILTISAHEQRRLGMDLHDGVGQQLAGIALLGKSHWNKLLAENHPGAVAAGQIATLTRQAIETTRHLAKGLYPIDLDQHGLLSALESLACQTRQQFQVDCELLRVGPPPCLEKSAEIHLYRIVQESIGNALKHASARSITIESKTEDGAHTLSVSDDGVGFPPDKEHQPGMGLRFMQYRARLINAAVEVERPATGGCKVVCRQRSRESLPAASANPSGREPDRLSLQEAGTPIYEAILSSIVDFAYIFDRSGRFVYANKPLLDLWGLELTEAVGKNFHELPYPTALAEKLQQQIQQVFETGQVLRDETLYISPTGVRGYFEYIFSPVFANDGTVEVVAGSTRDVSRRHHTEERLRDADRLKDEFLAMLAHELRNPLASVANAAALLKSAADPETHQWAAAVIERQTHQLTHLIDDLLDVSRITTGKIRLRKTVLDVATILDRACESAAPSAAERRHELTCNYAHGSLWIEGDPVRLEQIILNLLANAVKYTPLAGRIELSARVQEDELLVTVTDNGIGIEPARIPTMFQLFAQGERSTARSEGGLGIGLTIVQKLVEMHGGTIEAHSDGPGQGCTFTVHLPAAMPPLAVRSLPPTADINLQHALRVLIVDDNVDTAQGLARLLARAGYETSIAHDGAQALEKAHASCPQAIVLDIGLPGMDGFEVVRRLRGQPACADSLVIALTGYGQEEDRQRALAAGFNYHLVKPVNVDALKLLLAKQELHA